MFREKANSDAAAAGATVRWIETIVWARPFVAPRDRLLGAEEDTYMKTEPNQSSANESVPSVMYRMTHPRIDEWEDNQKLTETHVGDGY